MDATRSAVVGNHGLHEGSWAYLGLGGPDFRGRPDLRRQIIDACAESGWPGVSWSSVPHRGHDAGRYTAGMSHAVEHADVVIVLLDSESTTTDAELSFAYDHKRPVVGLSFASEAPQSSAMRAMLRSYERARIVECDDVEECAAGLRQVLSDPNFIALVDQAATEVPDHV